MKPKEVWHAVAHFPLGDKGGCNGLALDVKNRILFEACARSGNPPDPPQPMMVNDRKAMKAVSPREELLG
jgi:hypothetical protein